MFFLTCLLLTQIKAWESPPSPTQQQLYRTESNPGNQVPLKIIKEGRSIFVNVVFVRTCGHIDIVFGYTLHCVAAFHDAIVFVFILPTVMLTMPPPLIFL